MKLLICLVFVLAVLQPLRSQEPVFQNITIENGLPSNEIYHILEDSQGFLWFCTDRGVSQYDGHSFTNYTVNDGLMDNTVFKCVEDKEGRIWFLSLDQGLCYFQYGKISPFKYNQQIYKAGIQKCSKEQLVVLEDSIIVISVFIAYSISNKGKVTKLKSTEGLQINSLSDGRYYAFLGSREPRSIADQCTNTLRMNGGTSLLYTYKNPVHFTMLELENSTLFSPESEVFRLSKDTIQLICTFDNFIDCFYEDSKKGLWVGVVEDGVRLYEEAIGIGNVKRHLFKTKTVACLYEDREGGFWFSILGEGLFYTPNLYGIQQYNNKLPNIKVSDMCWGDKGNLYISFANGEIWIMNDNSSSKLESNYLPLRHGGHNPIYYNTNTSTLFNTKLLIEDFRKNRERISHMLKVVWNRNSKGVKLPEPFYTRIAPDKNGGLWLGSHSDLYYRSADGTLEVFRNNNTLTNTYDQYKLNVDALLGNFQGKTWIGSYDGVLSLENNKWTYYADHFKILSSRIDDIKAVDDSLILFASRGNGLLVFDGDSVFQISKKDGLSDDFVNSIQIDTKGNIWLGTNHGLNRIELSRTGKHQVKVYTVAHGLKSNHISKLLVHDDKIYVGTIEGLCVLDEENMNPNTVPPLIKLQKWDVTGASIPIKSLVELAHYQNSMSFDFIGITFNNGENVQYGYKLKGLESNWQYTFNSNVRYNSLPDGNYTFMVRARNADGYWSEPVSLTFSITPPLWKRGWFILLIVLVLLVLLLWIIRRRDNILTEKIAVKINFEKEVTNLKLKALRAQINPHFTFNTLNSIQNYILENDTRSANIYIARFATLIRKILSNSEHNTITLEDELEVLQKYLSLEKMRFKEKLNYTIDLDVSVDPYEDLVPPTIFQPYVENAIIHGIVPLKVNGKINIQLSKNENFLYCSIEDNGVGRNFNSSQKKNGISHGMVIGKSRIELFKVDGLVGSVNVIDLKDESGAPRGTCVEIKLPVISR